jgi:hypothetical protein
LFIPAIRSAGTRPGRPSKNSRTLAIVSPSSPYGTGGA